MVTFLKLSLFVNYDKGNNFTSVDHSVYRVSFPLMIHLRYSCSERFISSTKPFVQGA